MEGFLGFRIASKSIMKVSNTGASEQGYLSGDKTQLLR